MPPDSVGEPATYVDWTDEQLAERCRDSRVDDAFAELVRRYQRPVFRLAVSVLGQEFARDAEDVAQEAMLHMHQGLRSFRGDAKIGTWIYRIALNLALTAKSRTRFRSPHVNEQILGALASGDTPMDIQLGERRRQQALLTCVRELPEVYQAALRLHYWLGTSVSDIALMLNLPENTVKSYLFRARLLLRAMLTERGLDAQ